MGGGGYKEDPADKEARLRERRITDVDRQKSAEQNADGLTSDIRAIYGMKGLKPVRGLAPPIATTPIASMFNATGMTSDGRYSAGGTNVVRHSER
jgi:hypothetical protein